MTTAWSPEQALIHAKFRKFIIDAFPSEFKNLQNFVADLESLLGQVSEFKEFKIHRKFTDGYPLISVQTGDYFRADFKVNCDFHKTTEGVEVYLNSLTRVAAGMERETLELKDKGKCMYVKHLEHARQIMRYLGLNPKDVIYVQKEYDINGLIGPYLNKYLFVHEKIPEDLIKYRNIRISGTIEPR